MTREDREAIIRRLEAMYGEAEDNDNETKEALFYSIEALKERQHGEWIFCTDKLPEKDGDYIVSHLFCGEPEVGKSWFNTKSGFTHGMVYAWKPMPKPCRYKKEQELFKRKRKAKEGESN